MTRPIGEGFEEAWRRRFERYGDLHEDDASIAGWSSGGLTARFRRFVQLWEARGRCASGNWLDAGCGAGTYTRYLAGLGVTVTAVDYSYPTTRKAHERGPKGVCWITADITRLPFADGSFDGALCFGVMQALVGPERAAQELRRVLKSGARLWIDGLNAHCLPSVASEVQRRLTRRVQHLRYDAPNRFCAALAAAGFDSVERFWVPVLPSSMARLQPLVENTPVRRLFAAVSPIGSALSHSFLVCARAA